MRRADGAEESSMAAQRGWEPVAERVGAYLAPTLRTESIVQALYASVNDDELSLWLITDPADGRETLNLQATVGSQLRQFHEAAVRLHILNLRNYPRFSPDITLPDGARLLTRFHGDG
jgi:hypothetical protein